MPKISIIMPVYNGSKWLLESINSVINQTFTDFELICVNDSSLDCSEEILKDFSVKDSRIKCFTKENEGPGMALNYGIEKAKGKYLCFIDQDDRYADDYLKIMLNTIEQTGCNLCECNAYFEEEGRLTKIPYPKVNFKNNIVNIRSIKNKEPFSGNYFPQWTKIIDKSFWTQNNLNFPDRNNKAHDVPVHYKLIGLCDKIGYVNQCIYYHRVHKNQISYNFDSGFYYLISAEDILLWLKNLSNKNAVRVMKNFIKYLIFYSASLAKNDLIFNRLLDLINQNYDCVSRYKLRRYVIKRYKKYRRWKSDNLKVLQPVENAIVANNTYCANQPFIANSRTRIGSFVSIGENVRIGHGNHPLNFLSTSPYFYFDNLGWKLDEIQSHNEFWDYEPVNIGNDVWIGDNVLIKNGVKISDGAVIGMGAVVTKDVPPYAVVAGVPAKIIKYRFDEKTIEQLLELKWWNLPVETIKKIPYDDIKMAIQYINEQRNGDKNDK